MIYSTKRPKSPLIIIHQHQFGIKNIAFSPNSQFLASLGVQNDGFIHIWMITKLIASSIDITSKRSLSSHQVQLHSSNRCSASVIQMKWCSDDSIVTIGVRHSRLWKLNLFKENSTVDILGGKNFLMGEMLNEKFVDVISLMNINDDMENYKGKELGCLLLSTENGHLCLLDDTKNTLKLQCRTVVGTSISSINIDYINKKYWLAGNDMATIISKDIEEIMETPRIATNKPIRSSSTNSIFRYKSLSPTKNNNEFSGTPPNSSTYNDGDRDIPQSPTRYRRNQQNTQGIIAIEMLKSGDIIVLTGNNEICLFPSQLVKNETILSLSQSKIIISSIVNGNIGMQSLFNHKCVSSKDINCLSFITWSNEGIISFCSLAKQLDLDLKTLQVSITDSSELEMANQLSTAMVHDSKLIVGDRYGILQIISLQNFIEHVNSKDINHKNSYDDYDNANVTFMIKSHSSEIKTLCYINDLTKDLIISASRDRTIQILEKSKESNNNHNNWNILQTIMEHKGNILKTIVSKNQKFIITSSADRTILIHKRCKLKNKEDPVDDREEFIFVLEKLISLKSTPVEIYLHEFENQKRIKNNDNSNYNCDIEDISELIITTNDKQIHTFSFPEGNLITSFKSIDENGELLTLDHIIVTQLFDNGSYYLVGAGNDKSIRVYDYKTGSLISSCWGHSGTICGLIEIEVPNDESDVDSSARSDLDSNTLMVDENISKTFITSDSSGCIFLWEFSLSDNIYNDPILPSPIPSPLTLKRFNSRRFNVSPLSKPIRKVVTPDVINEASRGKLHKKISMSSLKTSGVLRNSSPMRIKPDDISRSLGKSQSVMTLNSTCRNDLYSDTNMNLTGSQASGSRKIQQGPVKVTAVTGSSNNTQQASSTHTLPTSTGTHLRGLMDTELEGDEMIDSLTTQLDAFQAFYNNHLYKNQERLETLKGKIQSTLGLLGGDVEERRMNDAVLERFGERMVAILEHRLERDPNPRAHLSGFPE